MEAPCIFYTANSSATGMDNLNIILNRGFLFFWSLTFKSYSIFILIYTVNSYLPKVLLQMCKKCICPTEGVYVVITYWLHPPGQCVRTCINITHYINIMKTLTMKPSTDRKCNYSNWFEQLNWIIGEFVDVFLTLSICSGLLRCISPEAIRVVQASETSYKSQFIRQIR